MKQIIKDNKFNTKIGEFYVVEVPKGSEKLLQNGSERISGYDLKNNIFYVANYLEGIWKNECAKSFIRAIEEERLVCCIELFIPEEKFGDLNKNIVEWYPSLNMERANAGWVWFDNWQEYYKAKYLISKEIE